MQRFRTKGWCKFIVALEMSLAASTILVMLAVMVYKMSVPSLDEDGDGQLLQKPFEAKQISELIVLLLVYVHYGVQIILFFSGLRVFSEAGSLSPQSTDCKMIGEGIKSCDVFCSLELLRVVLLLLSFFGEIIVRSNTFLQQSFIIGTNISVIFGWFFTSEFRNELKIHREEVTHGIDLCPFPQQDWVGNMSEVQQENREFGETAMYSVPGIASYINDFMR